MFELNQEYSIELPANNGHNHGYDNYLFTLKLATTTTGDPNTKEKGLYAARAIANKTSQNKLIYKFEGNQYNDTDPSANIIGDLSNFRLHNGKVFVPNKNQIGIFINDPLDIKRENCLLNTVDDAPGIFLYKQTTIAKGKELLAAYGDDYWRQAFLEEPDKFPTAFRQKVCARYKENILKRNKEIRQQWRVWEPTLPEPNIKKRKRSKTAKAGENGGFTTSRKKKDPKISKSYSN